MTTLLFASPLDSPQAWQEALQQLMPDLEVRVWPDVRHPRDIEYALVWKPPAHVFDGLVNLKVIFSLGAGVDHLLANTELPPGVPVVRMLDPALAEGMSEYVLYHVLRYHRHMPEYESQQRRCEWRELPQIRPNARRVGIMGLGVLGTDAAVKLTALGFAVAGWSRGHKEIPGIQCFHGLEQLEAFLRCTDIVVCLLPLTRETAGILNERTLALLLRGAYVINAARGGHLAKEELLAALDTGRLAGATLDAFRTEPLPSDHPFWQHPRVTVTPHIASLTNPFTAAEHIVQNIGRAQRGEPLMQVVDMQRGY